MATAGQSRAKGKASSKRINHARSKAKKKKVSGVGRRVSKTGARSNSSLSPILELSLSESDNRSAMDDETGAIDTENLSMSSVLLHTEVQLRGSTIESDRRATENAAADGFKGGGSSGDSVAETIGSSVEPVDINNSSEGGHLPNNAGHSQAALTSPSSVSSAVPPFDFASEAEAESCRNTGSDCDPSAHVPLLKLVTSTSVEPSSTSPANTCVENCSDRSSASIDTDGSSGHSRSRPSDNSIDTASEVDHEDRDCHSNQHKANGSSDEVSNCSQRRCPSQCFRSLYIQTLSRTGYT